MSHTDYVQDIPFRSAFNPPQSPAAMRYVALQQGFIPPDDARPFTLIDLGCGEGATLLALATLYPYATFYGVDFNPHHIATAKERAAALALTNVCFLQHDFAELPTLTTLPPRFDFITCNGIYGWLAPPLTEAIDRFVAERLAPNGLFYVEYLSSPGKLAIAELWRFLKELCPLDAYEGDHRARAEAALTLLERLAKRGPRFFAEHPTALRAAQHYLSRYKKEPYQIDQFAHNAMAEYFTPRRFTEMHHRMARAGLRFVGNTDPAHNDWELSVPPTFLPLVRERPESDVAQRELLKDFIRCEHDRRDLWTRADVAPNPEEAAALLANGFGLLARTAPEKLVRALEPFPGCRVALTGPIYDPLIAAAAAESAWLPALTETPPAPSWRTAFNRLVCSGQFALLTEPPGAAQPLSSASRWRWTLAVNRTLLRDGATRLHGVTLVSPVTRQAGITLTPLEAVLLEACSDGETLLPTEDKAARIRQARAFLEAQEAQELPTATGYRDKKKLTDEELTEAWEPLEAKLNNAVRLRILAAEP
ncbi:class I SAM-dependent methyltransferase [Hydrogenophilus thiooxidans]|uniref:class I SAM-dependent methyltransferase n=1 Tax=Hydrogenophilus thiooxidans TaxID=2820326 RepID=UPI001C21FA6C|nr:class I SAM-dependent methyltransferase [Hydrogenophilus thiooxidans]